MQIDLDERRKKADESSAQGAELSALRSSSNRDITSKYRAKVPKLDHRERRDLTKNLETSFMTTDEQGNIVPKTPQGALIEATTYLMSNVPAPGDPKEAVHRTTMASLGLIGKALANNEGRHTAPVAQQRAKQIGRAHV